MEKILQVFPSMTLTDDEFNTSLDIIRVLLRRGELNEHEPCNNIANLLTGELGMSKIEGSYHIILKKGNIRFDCGIELIGASVGTIRTTMPISIRTIVPISSIRDIISVLRSAGVLRIKDIGRYTVLLSSSEVDKLFNNVKSRVSGKVLIPLERDKYLFIRRGDSLVRLERIGEVFANKYLLIPKDSLNDLILSISIWESELHDTQEAGIFMHWYSPEIFLKPQEFLKIPQDARRSSTVEPNELVYYHVDPGDRINIPLSVLRIMKQEDRDTIIRLSNIFNTSELQVASARDSMHILIQDRLVEIGERIGFKAVKEYDIGGFRLDVAWLEDDDVAYAFEVVISGSLIEALYRLNQVDARRILIVKDEDLEKAISKAGGGIRVLPASLILNGKIHEVVREVLGGSQGY